MEAYWSVRIYLLILILVFLAGCKEKQRPDPSPAPEGETKNAVTATRYPTTTPWLFPTPKPSNTANFQLLTLAAEVVDAEPTMTATPTVKPTAAPAPIPPDVQFWVEESFESPSKEWLATILIMQVQEGGEESEERPAYDLKSSTLYVTGRGYKRDWVVEKIDIENFMGYTLAWPLAWSQDEKILYYTHRFGGGDGCFGQEDFYGTDLFEFDLESGESTQILPKVGYWVALSPDQTMFSALDREGLVIYEMETGGQQRISFDTIDGYNGGTVFHRSDLIWSPDSRSIAYTLSIDICNGPNDAKSSVVLFDVSSMESLILIENDEHCYTTVEWLDNGLILLQDENQQNWEIDPSTAELDRAG